MQVSVIYVLNSSQSVINAYREDPFFMEIKYFNFIYFFIVFVEVVFQLLNTLICDLIDQICFPELIIIIYWRIILLTRIHSIKMFAFNVFFIFLQVSKFVQYFGFYFSDLIIKFSLLLVWKLGCFWFHGNLNSKSVIVLF